MDSIAAKSSGIGQPKTWGAMPPTRPVMCVTADDAERQKRKPNHEGNMTMKYLQPIAAAMGYRIVKASQDGYSGYRVLNGYGMSAGQLFDSLDSVAEHLAKKAAKAREELRVM